MEESTIKGVHAAMRAVMSDVQSVVKRKVQSYRAFNVDDIYREVRAAFITHKLTIYPKKYKVKYIQTEAQLKTDSSPQIKKSETAQVKGKWKITAEDGSSIKIVGIASSQDYNDKAIIQANQLGLKFALVQTFLIPAGDYEAEQPPDYRQAARQAARPAASLSSQQGNPTNNDTSKAKQQLLDTLSKGTPPTTETKAKAKALWDAAVAHGPDATPEETLANIMETLRPPSKKAAE